MIPEGVGRTALGVAMVRAMESRRPDRLFDDPYAASFLAASADLFGPSDRGAAAIVGGVSRKAAGFWSQAVVRTRFFDDYLLAAAADGLRQIVVVASGLDTRAYRLAWPSGVRLFEVDRADVLDFKHRVLRRRGATAACLRRAVAADLRLDWSTPLLAAGFSPDEPAAWLLEGLLIYLTGAEVNELLATVHRLSAVDSRAAFEAGDVSVASAAEVPAIAAYTALWKGGLADPSGWLSSHGWRVDVHDEVSVAARYRRPPAGSFLTATLPRSPAHSG